MSKSASASSRPLRCRKGIAAVEFAVVGGIFLVALLAAVDLGRYWMTIQGLRNFIADAERYGIVNMRDIPGVQTATCDQVINATGRGGAVAALLRTSGPWCVRRETVVAGGVSTIHVDVAIDVTFNFVINVFGIASPRFQESTRLTFTY